MSGKVNSVGSKSGIVDGPIISKSVLQAYCRITSDTPSSGQIDESLNVKSISYGANTFNLTLERAIHNPKVTFNTYQWSTGNQWHICTVDATSTGLQSTITFMYRKITQGSTGFATSGTLNHCAPCVYGDVL